MSSTSPRRVLLIGAGGHARVCLEALSDMDHTEVVGAVSDDGSGIAGLGVAVLGLQADLDEIAVRSGATEFCIAIGNNTIRQQIGDRLRENDGILAVAVSRFSMLSATASIAPGAQLLAGSVVNPAAAIGTGTIINTNATVEHDCQIGEYVHIAPGAVLGGNVIVGPLAFVGLGSRVLPGLAIGAGATIGAGAVVVNDVEPGVTVVGVPARAVAGRAT